jgi:hypothetical protein
MGARSAYGTQRVTGSCTQRTPYSTVSGKDSVMDEEQASPFEATIEDPVQLLQQLEADLSGYELLSERARVFKRASALLTAQGRATEPN